MERHQYLLLSLGLLAAVSACAPAREAGVADPDAFRATATGPSVASTRSAAEFARCFEDRGALLPMSAFDEVGDGVTYRLRGFGRTYEEISFEPVAGGGSVAQVRIAPNLGARWRAGFERDRGAVLNLCATGEAQ